MYPRSESPSSERMVEAAFTLIISNMKPELSAGIPRQSLGMSLNGFWYQKLHRCMDTVNPLTC